MGGILKKYKSLSVQVKATMWFTICNFLLKGISFITIPIFTRLLSTEEYGTVAIYNSYQQLFLIFATFELSLGAYQRGILKFKDSVKDFTKAIQLLCTCITIIVFIITFIFRDVFVSLTDTSLSILILMFLYFLVEPAYNCWLNEKRFYYDYKPAVAITLLYTVCTTGGALLAVVLIRHTAIIRIGAMLICSILFCLPFYLRNINFLSIKKNKVLTYWKFALAFQLPLVLHSLSYLVLGQADRVMIGMFVGNSEAAIYSVAYSVAEVVNIFQTSLNQVMKPWRYQRLEAKEYKDVNTNTNFVLLFMGVIVIMFILVAPEIMKLLFSADYYEAIWTIPPITLSVYFMFLYTVFVDIESYYSKTKYVMYASVTCAVVNIILNYFGIKLFGYIACGYTTLISYILFALLHYCFVKRVCRQENIKEKLFNTRIILLMSISLIVITFGIILLYQTILVRYILLLVVLLILFVNRKQVMKMISNLRS